MENYNWHSHSALPFASRYPTDLLSDSNNIAVAKWFDWAVNPREWNAERSLSWLGDDYFNGPDPDRFRIPRVFISHRRADYVKAKNVAKIVSAEGFNYWLDVEDPTLRAINTMRLSRGRISSIAIASIIEMALLNSTHVLAIQTKKTPGSLWVPYEYGRVKPKTPRSWAAGCRCWLPPTSSDFPEYLHLGVICEDDNSLKNWLRKERMQWP